MFQASNGMSSNQTTAAKRDVAAGATSDRTSLNLASSIDWSLLWRHKYLILGSTVLCLLAGIAIDAIVPPRYRAFSEILIGPVDLRVVEKDVIPPSATADANVIQVESETRVLTSDKVLRRVVETERLAADPEFRGGSGSAFGQVLAAPLAIFRNPATANAASDPEATALQQLKRDVLAKRNERTYVVELAVETGNPDKSARLANAVVQAYLEEQSAARTAATRRVSDSLSARLSELKARVQRAEETAQRYRSANDMVGVGGRLVQEQQVTDLSNQLMLARARAAEAKARYEQIDRLSGGDVEAGATLEAVQSSTIGRLREQYAMAARVEASLASKLGSAHPDLIDARAQLANAKRLVADEIKRVAEANRIEYERALANQNSLSRDLDALKHSLLDTNLAAVKLRELEREVEASRAVYESYLVRARETQEQERLDTANVRVISDAQPPLERSRPPRRLVILAASLAAGLAGGFGLAGLSEFARRRPRPRILTPL